MEYFYRIFTAINLTFLMNMKVPGKELEYAK